MKKDTSWGEVAGWYDDMLAGDDTYQQKVILPNLIRAMNIKKGETIADVACGNGFFSGQFLAAGARVIGFDISPELITAANKKYGGDKSNQGQASIDPATHSDSHLGNRSRNHSGAEFFVASAEDPDAVAKGFSELFNKTTNEIGDKKASNPSGKAAIQTAIQTADKAVCVLAIQNIENIKGLFESCRRILAPTGSLYIVMNHPAYRIPQGSSWGFDETSGRQYRRVDGYLSEMKIPIVMNPGREKPRQKSSEKPITTISFHRPLQYYFKLLQAAGFSVSRLEEWISHRRSQPGPRQKEEDRVRGEFPLFLFIEARRLAS